MKSSKLEPEPVHSRADLDELASDVADPVATGDILLVDGGSWNVLDIERALQGLAGKVIRAVSGAEALRKLLEQDFALILLDLWMPSMDGLETASLIRRRKRCRRIPIFFLSASAPEDRQMLQGYSLGAVDFLSKPISGDVLRAKASLFIDLRRRTAQVARQLVQANERLADADRQKNEILAVLGHELRHPLAPLSNGLELLRLHLDSHHPLQHDLLRRSHDLMAREVNSLRGLVDDLLDIARINGGTIELRNEPVDLGNIVRQAVIISRPWMDERDHELTLVIDDEPILVEGDSVRLTQIVVHLLNNAARYTPPHGHIELTAVRHRASRRSHGEQPRDSALIHVQDSGHGIGPDLLPRVFDMFVQRGGEGLGLGLALARQLVELHGGRVRVHSEGMDRGSSFSVWLPVIDPEAEIPHGTAEQRWLDPERSGRALHVLVIDDREEIRESMRELLRVWGCDVRVASDGEEGLKAIVNEVPDIALVDIGMPKLDGFTVARRVREAMPESPVRLVAMTGFGQERDYEKALASGFDAHLVKPVSAASLRRVLGR